MLKISLKKLVIVLFAISIALVFLDLLCFNAMLSKSDYLLEKIYLFFDTNGEFNISSYYSSLLLFASSIIIFMIAYLGKNKLSWLMMSGLFLFAATDEVVQIHEWTKEVIKHYYVIDNFFSANSWIILYAVIVILVFLLNIRFFLRLPSKTIRLIFVSAAIFLFGAVVIEMIEGNYMINSFEYKYLTMIEEFLEMAGSIFFIYTFLDYIRSSNKNKIQIQLV